MDADQAIRMERANASDGLADNPRHERGRVASVRQRATVYLPAYAVPALLSLAVIPILTRQLGPREFGIYAICLSVHGCLLSLAADPTTTSLNRFYSMTPGITDRRRLSKALFGLTVVLAATVAGGALLVLAVTAVFADIGPWGGALVATAVMTALFTLWPR